jgi:hypothetical protein
MPKPPRPWIVTRHDPIEELDDNLWAVNGDVPGFPPAAAFHRRMSIVRLSDGRLLFHNAIPLDDASLAKVRAWGKPALLLVPHHLHAMDAHPFREKLGLEAYTSGKAIVQVRAILPVEGPLEALPRDPAFTVEPLAGTRFGEAAVLVKSGPRVSLLLCDAVTNSRHGRGLAGLAFRLMGLSGPEPKTAPLYRLRAVSDKEAFRTELLRLADTPGLVRVVPSHGPVISQDPGGALKRAAAGF